MSVSRRCAFGVVALLLLSAASVAQAETWAEKLGYPAGKRVMILHADDIGMCYEANERGQGLSAQPVTSRSAAMMVPCPWYNEIADWYKENPEYDLGLHLAMNSEWKWYRWGPVAGRDAVPGMVDKDGYLQRRQIETATQRQAGRNRNRDSRPGRTGHLARACGPGHIDTHMGTLYARLDFTARPTEGGRGVPHSGDGRRADAGGDRQVPQAGLPDHRASRSKLMANYKLPKLDDFQLPCSKARRTRRSAASFTSRSASMRPGLNEIIFHPSVLTETTQGDHRHLAAASLGSPDVLRSGGARLLRARGDSVHQLERDHETLGRSYGDTLPKAKG